MRELRIRLPVYEEACGHVGTVQWVRFTLTTTRGLPIIAMEAHMFGGGLFEIGGLLFIAFLLIGPKKVPEIARTLGKGLGELRRASNELKNSLEEEIKNLDRLPESRSDTTSTYGHHDPEPTHEEPGPRS